MPREYRFAAKVRASPGARRGTGPLKPGPLGLTPGNLSATRRLRKFQHYGVVADPVG